MFPLENWMFKSFFDKDSSLETHQLDDEIIEDIRKQKYNHMKKPVDIKKLNQIQQSCIVFEGIFIKKCNKNDSQNYKKNSNQLKKVKIILVNVQSSYTAPTEGIYKPKYEIYYHILKENQQNLFLISLNRLRLQFIQLDQTEDIFNNCLRFIKDKESLDLYTHQKHEAKKLFILLKETVVLHQFHQSYKVLKIIGKGHFAKVYLANRKDDKKQFAIKAFSKEYLYSQNQGKESFISEIQLMRQLNNPNLIKLHEVHETENSLYLVMELIKGGELLKAMNNKKFNEITIAKAMFKLLLAIDSMHSQKIMHRDLKPDNILLRNQNDITDLVIADFGLSTYQNIDYQLFQRCGTPGYVAPEVLKFQEGNKFYTTQCDLFSLGCIFYIFIVGNKVFRGKEQKEVILLNRDCNIDFDNINYFQNISESAKDLLKQLLQKDPLKRINAIQALQHPFIKQAYDDEQDLCLQFNIHMKIDQDVLESQIEQQKSKLGNSFASFQMNDKVLLKGVIDTLDKLNSQNNDSFAQQKLLQSKLDSQNTTDYQYKKQYKPIKNSLFSKQ